MVTGSLIYSTLPYAFAALEIGNYQPQIALAAAVFSL
jgi:hypothetical protein